MATGKQKKEMVHWLERALRTNPAGWPLPEDASLAVQFGLSERTVRRYLTDLAREGRIDRLPRKGSFKAKKRPDSSTQKATTVLRVYEHFRSRIQDGTLKNGDTLPSVKYCSSHLRVSPRTTIAAYRRLVEDGYVSKIGKRFIVGIADLGLLPGARREAHVFVYGTDDIQSFFAANPLAPAYRKMEHELIRHGFVVIFHGMNEFERLKKRWKRSMRFPHAALFTHLSRSEYTATVSKLEALVKSAGPGAMRAIIVGEIEGSIRRIRDISVLGHPHVARTLSKTIAQFVHNKHFAKVKLFYDRSIPSRRRLGGHVKTLDELHHLSPGLDMQLVLQSPEVPMKHYAGVVGEYGDMTLEHLRSAIVFCDKLADQYQVHGTNELWLFGQDHHAVKALEWAKSRNIDVPSKLSIMGLENNEQYFTTGLTTCEVDFDTIGYQMAHSLIGDFAVAKTPEGYIKAQAMVVERLTTR